MDKLALRRALYTDPKQINVQQLADDSTLLQLRQELLRMDQQLTDTLQVPVPDTLTERMLLAQRLEQPVKRRIRLPYYAVAASVLLASLWFAQLSQTPDADAGQQALAHVYHEMAALDSRAELPAEQVNELFAELGIDVGAISLPVRYARFCHFGGVRSLHLVLDWQGEAVTLFVIPPGWAHASDKPLQFADARFVGQSIQKAGHQLVLVAQRAELLQATMDRLGNTLKFTI